MAKLERKDIEKLIELERITAFNGNTTCRVPSPHPDFSRTASGPEPYKWKRCLMLNFYHMSFSHKSRYIGTLVSYIFCKIRVQELLLGILSTLR